MLNSKGPAATSELHIQQLPKAPQVPGQTSSETGSELGNNSDHSSGYSSRSTKALQAMPNMPNGMRYSSPSQLQHPMSIITGSYAAQNLGLENGYMPGQHQDEQQNQAENLSNPGRTSGNEAVKAFACTTCSKGFARRSDLARHERIHSGVRPHMCDHPGCKKQFIQRSALTVHARVHTGEKPHMCERCSKPFSDSSSLARHRRIHSGKRPYKCPYADCQKTFTRRTTLTRHQNHHTGTVEEAAASTAAILASASRPSGYSQRTDSDGGTYSETVSAQSTPSIGPRHMSMSPASEIPHMPALNRQSSDFSYLPPGSLPPHMRPDLQSQPSPRSSPSAPSPPLSSFGSNPHRPSLTSHPSVYGPPPILEPPTHHEQRQPASGGSSPHLSSVGWHSPSHPGMGSPSHHGEPYMYPEPPYGPPAPHLYYPSSNLRRPQSTEPDQYDTKPRIVGEVWNGQM